MIAILAQSGGDLGQLGGGAAGWAGAGLLAGVLGWLMFIHLPAVFKQHKEDMEAKDKLVVKVVDDFKEEMRLERESHDSIVKQQREEATAKETRLADLLLSNTSETRLLSAAVTNLAQQAGLVTRGGPT